MKARLKQALAAAILLIGLLVMVPGCIPTNFSPVASFTRTPSYGESPLAVYFDATASYDPDGAIATYEWSFGDGATGEGISTTHIYETSGSYEAGLTVSDEGGVRDSTIRMITVSDSDQEIPVGTQVGQLAPQFALKDLNGENVSISDFRGRIVILDFWASWCSPCRNSMPHLETLRARYQDDGLVLLGVSLDYSAETAVRFLQENGYSNLIALWESLPAAQEVRRLYGVSGIPHTFVLDRQGIIRYSDHPIRLRDRDIEPWL